MSARLLGWAWRVPLTNIGGSAPSTQQLVLVALVDLTSDSGRTRPEASVAKLATMTRLGRSAVSAALGALETQRVIVALNGRSGGRVATRWMLGLARGEGGDDGSTARQDDGSTARQDDGFGRQPRASDAANRAPDGINRAPGARVSLPSLEDPLPSGGTARARAERIARPWWDRQAPKPSGGFAKTLKVCAAALTDGWAEAELAAALEAMGAPVTGAALDLWRRRQANGHEDDPARYRPLTDDEHAAVTAFRVEADEHMARLRVEREQR